ncbi:hypothetical protein OVS_03805 [Mycoplasma ovis str. Michigan]|uniref:Chromosome partition protein Smc n=1 Tax=Mycoplasma ovis str. Michigan TaxID=1415773 RepID=A0ABM5P2B7_9MOLU|nr:hypothetical protein [Mycoplasma ovis]AHC40493.1 hypothetical protein OVS_03805 [Mycoplasma ovis str. Michigan]
MALFKAIALGGSELLVGGAAVGVGINKHFSSPQITQVEGDSTTRGGLLEQKIKKLQEKIQELNSLKEQVENLKQDLLKEGQQQSESLASLEEQLATLKQQKSELEGAQKQIKELLDGKEKLEILVKQWESQERQIETLRKDLEGGLQAQKQVEKTKQELEQELQSFQKFSELYNRLFGGTTSKDSIGELRQREDFILGLSGRRKAVVAKLRKNFSASLNTFIHDLKTRRDINMKGNDEDKQKFMKRLEEILEEWKQVESSIKNNK